MSRGLGSRRTDQLMARHRRHWRIAFTISFAAHLLLFLLFGGEGAPPSPYAAAGPREGDPRAAPLGGGMQVIDLVLESAAPLPVVPPPVPVPDIEVEVEPLPELERPEVSLPDLGEGGMKGDEGDRDGEGSERGVEGGRGRGDGGTEEEGHSRVTPPAPRGLILPPGDRPGRVRGKEVVVWVFVDERGRVISDSTRLLPPTGDSKFDERLRKQASEWVFRPAQRGDESVAEWFRYTIRL